ncbi:class IV adenylate cyclase [candidate division KSB1 bacterium]
MANNIEIKARINDFNKIIEKVEQIHTDGPVILEQEDIFYRCPFGRLKLRIFKDKNSELIYYRRPDQTGPKNSLYYILRISKPELVNSLLSVFPGRRGVIKKTRKVYFVENTRVHLDEVENLGKFLELEVVLKPGNSADEGIRTAEKLMEHLEINKENLIDKAYIDLLK